MKLLFVHERFGAMAGAEVNAFLTASELKSRGHTVGIIHGAGTGKNEAGWRETFSACFPLQNGDSARIVGGALKEFQPDAVYVHKMADLGVIEALVKSRYPLVRMVHDHDIYCMRSYKYNPLNRNICTRPTSPFCIFPCGAAVSRNRDGGLPVKWVSYLDKRKEIRLNRRFHRMVVATHYMKEELVRNRFDQRLIEIHAPVPKTIESGLRASFSDRNLILYSGQLIRGKGVDVLLEALAELKMPFQCIILGEGSHRPFCEDLSRRLGLSDRVQFKGFVPQDELKSFYVDASLTVMSSVWPEPFGAAGLEGMRYGLPVVAFDAGGIKEWLLDGYNGYLVPWMDRPQFTARVKQLLQDKDLARHQGERGRMMVRDKFNFAQYIQNLETMFAKVVSETQSRPAHET
ncbi:glycosyltransferase family 4 protein [Pedosphaera parvula]|uniref:Glycosyl transferase group 1 n=1 Tax=Pedosphaera parvula (strain Ellin514) TaxID=320771 RepID=B9XCF9_PEDPL|nr:glycosyltransferase family 4 protein [Pedosphaera parvula]EEF62627.1 glycosyl transferase group 1 [Pedosphaera parvula Ellin514]